MVWFLFYKIIYVILNSFQDLWQLLRFWPASEWQSTDLRQNDKNDKVSEGFVIARKYDEAIHGI